MPMGALVKSGAPGQRDLILSTPKVAVGRVMRDVLQDSVARVRVQEIAEALVCDVSPTEFATIRSLRPQRSSAAVYLESVCDGATADRYELTTAARINCVTARRKASTASKHRAIFRTPLLLEKPRRRIPLQCCGALKSPV